MSRRRRVAAIQPVQRAQNSRHTQQATAHKSTYHSRTVKHESSHCGRGRNGEIGIRRGLQPATRQERKKGAKKEREKKGDWKQTSKGGQNRQPAPLAMRGGPLVEHTGFSHSLWRPGARVEGRRVEHPRQCRSLHYGVALYHRVKPNEPHDP